MKPPAKDPAAAPPSLPGIDIDDALARLGGQWNILKLVLCKFAENNQESAADLRRALDNGDLDQAQKLVHRIKGSSANISAERLRAAAIALETTLRQGQSDDVGALLAQFEGALSEILQTAATLD